ncbi:MAG: glutamate synthase-related protein [Anaerolineae bacterium]|nr:glutamate synthase-related protein [Anaerolineae bacterium]
MVNHISQQRSNSHLRHLDLHEIDTAEHDACALICTVRKGGQPTHGNVKRTIEALARMGHRTGYINGEGDGVGILTDIPRQLWSKWLAEDGLMGSLAADRHFWIAHVFIPTEDKPRVRHIIEQICRTISEAGLHLLTEREGRVNSRVLGPNAEKNEPAFWQIAGVNGQVASDKLDATLFELQTQLEDDLGVHFPSFSRYSVVYKVQGTIEILRRYYPELRDPAYASTVTMGHARYSTNTNPIFERAQPFSVIGHNGEFNTISRFRLEALMLDMPLQHGGSDSQDIDRVIHALIAHHDLDLIETMEHIFPPYEHDLIQNRPEIKSMYDTIRQSWGHFAQGPAAVAARLGNQLVFSVDALGLRPLWFGETEKEFFASSERGVYQLDAMARSPKPMAPGEKIAIQLVPGNNLEVLDYPAIQRHVYARYTERNPAARGALPSMWASADTNSQPPFPVSFGNKGNGNSGTQTQLEQQPVPVVVAEIGSTPDYPTVISPAAQRYPWQDKRAIVDAAVMSGMGWERYHSNLVSTLAQNAKEAIGSLGWDGSLAAMSQTRMNLADYFKETVAVVTNPAIDREREQSQFSTQMLVGARPEIGHRRDDADLLIQLETPFLLGGLEALGSEAAQRAIADRHGTMTINQLIALFDDRATILSAGAALDETIEAAIERLQNEVIDAVLNGTQCLILDDTAVADGQRLWIDPLLLTSAVDKALRQADAQPNLRRRTGIVVRSASLRDLHDMALCISFGANAILPYALYAVAIGIAPRGSRNHPDDDQIIHWLSNTVKALTVGLEKVTSTIGCHELRGYGHSFSSIGLAKGIANIFSTPNYFGSEARGLTWTALQTDAEERAAEFRGEARARLKNPDRFNPKYWKKAEAVADGKMSWEQYSDEVQELENRLPVSIRHILSIKAADEPQVNPADVDMTVGNHSMPMIISAMSFGSQGELAYRTYAEAAKLLNTVCMNGEGGELPDMLGKFKTWRGQQVASGRFGVNIGFLNSADFIEIKIGQGAKPGEGGHLPGFKVTEQVAASRSTTPGVALISPSNNHDLYSIEDLAQLIDELKNANPLAKISVKIPVVPGVGIIAVGVAKAGADIITITGYSGGTGAARTHALRHVGLPAEIGVWLSHHALLDSGLRKEVELWVDGGMKTGRDVVKFLCLGANRVGFGTLAMLAVGCTICRGCQDGTCHVGITTHVKTVEEAEMKGFKAFRPFQEKGSPEGIVRVFEALAEDVRCLTARLGFTRTQDLVGRADLLEQVSLHDRIDLTQLLKPAPEQPEKRAQPGGLRVARPRNIVSRQISDVVSHYVAKGEYELTYDDEQVMAQDRALGTHLSGAIARGEVQHSDRLKAVHLSFSNSAVPGNGLGAFLESPVNILAEGGAQDGVGKCAKSGRISILKGLNHNGTRLDGSVGKSFAYGAQGGLFIIQGNADTRACIRMSGADVVFGGEIREPLRDELGGLGARANLKGYAFEYMTSGRVLVLGDPGPWICAGMTGGAVYQRIQSEMNLTIDAIRYRIAPGSPVEIVPLDENGAEDVHQLLSHYIKTLELNNQPEAAIHLYALLKEPQNHFIKIAPSVKV